MAGFGDILRRVRRRSAETPEPGAADQTPPPAPPASEPPAANDAGDAVDVVDPGARFRPPITEPPPAAEPRAVPASEPPAANDAGDAVDAGVWPRPPITEPPPPAEPEAAASPVAPGNPAERAAAGERDWGEPLLRPAAGSEYAGPPEPPTLIAGDGPATPPPSSTPAGPLLPPPELAPSDFAPPELRPPELASPELAPPELAPQNAPITAPTAPVGIPDRAGDAPLPPPPGAPDDDGDAADAGACADSDAGRADDTASDDPMLLICPYCGRPEQRVGSRCERCNGVIVRLPVWAQRRRRNWLSRRLSWRRIIAACFIVLLILFVVWINYPFAPNPVVLFKNIQGQMTIDDSPGAWSVAGRDLRHSRNVQLGPPPPQGVIAWENNDVPPPPLNSEPVARRNDIYVGSASGIYPLKENNGNLREEWQGNTPGRVTAAAAVAETSLFFGSTDHTVNAWDALNGDVRWSFPADDTVEVAPVVSGGLVYISSGRGQVYALDAHNGNLIWQEQLDSNASAAVAIHDGKLFVGDEQGIFYILSARTGQERFRYRTTRAVSGSPVVSADGQRVYFASGGQLYAIDAQAREVPGLYQFKQIWAQLWLWQVPGVPRPRGQQGDIWRFTPDNPLQGISSGPALAEEDDNGHKILYAGAHDHYLYALNATHSAVDDRLLWAYEAQEAIWASPLVVKDQVIFGDVAGNVYSVDRITGELDWRIDLGAPVRIAPIVSNGLLVVRTEDGVIHGIK